MKPSVEIVHVPLPVFLYGIAAVLPVILAVFLIVRLWIRRKPNDEAVAERDWSIPAIDTHADVQSPFHRWDPRIKIASLLLFVFCVATVSQPVWAAFALSIAAASVLIARIPLQRPLRRLAAMGGFLAMFLIVMPLTVPHKPGDILLAFDSLPFTFNLRGLSVAGLICLKASAVALMMEPLLGTSPFSVTMQAFSKLGLPGRICEMILLTYRYIFVFYNEMKRMNSGMKARGFQKRTSLETLRTLGNFLGMLLVHSFERTQRVFEAMLSRGYSGALPGYATFRAHPPDWIKGALWVAIAVGLLSADRLWKVSFL